MELVIRLRNLRKQQRKRPLDVYPDRGPCAGPAFLVYPLMQKMSLHLLARLLLNRIESTLSLRGGNPQTETGLGPNPRK